MAASSVERHPGWELRLSPLQWLGARGRSRSSPPRERLVIIGNGMVGQRFCERLLELGAERRFEIVVLSEEELPAYDRVHLGEVLRGRRREELCFRDIGWYAARGIELRLSEAAVSVELAERVVVTARGERVPYAWLVLATGSRAVLPPLPPSDGVELSAYRTMVDAERVLERVRHSQARALPVGVIGGGLLGVEAARSFQRLGARVVVFEASSQLMPRQLDPEASSALENVLCAAGLELKLRRKISGVSRAGEALSVELSDGEQVAVGAVVVAAGARAADELGVAAGLRCHARGGVEVSSRLMTSYAGVYAIGECARHRDVPHGLVAPGYVMADVLAENLSGKRRRVGPQSVVTRLKLDLTEVTVLGDPVRAERDQELVFRRATDYRRVLVRGRRIVAAVAIGTWDELPALQELVARGGRVSRKALMVFREQGSLGLARGDEVSRLPDAAVVCQCVHVSCGRLRTALGAGHVSVSALSNATGAGTLCGSCLPRLAQLCGSPASTAPAGRLLPVAAWGGLLLAACTLLAPRVPIAQSALQRGLGVLFTTSLLKQASGFLVVAFVVLGLALSLRKRTGWFRVSTYRALRVLHGVLGTLGVIGLFLHTGFRLGHSLNLVLMLVFLLSASSGALSALLGAAHAERALTLASALRRAHEISFWPLPVLILFHALKTYYF